MRGAWIVLSWMLCVAAVGSVSPAIPLESAVAAILFGAAGIGLWLVPEKARRLIRRSAEIVAVVVSGIFFWQCRSGVPSITDAVIFLSGFLTISCFMPPPRRQLTLMHAVSVLLIFFSVFLPEHVSVAAQTALFIFGFFVLLLLCIIIPSSAVTISEGDPGAVRPQLAHRILIAACYWLTIVLVGAPVFFLLPKLSLSFPLLERGFSPVDYHAVPVDDMKLFWYSGNRALSDPVSAAVERIRNLLSPRQNRRAPDHSEPEPSSLMSRERFVKEHPALNEEDGPEFPVPQAERPVEAADRPVRVENAETERVQRLAQMQRLITQDRTALKFWEYMYGDDPYRKQLAENIRQRLNAHVQQMHRLQEQLQNKGAQAGDTVHERIGGGMPGPTKSGKDPRQLDAEVWDAGRGLIGRPENKEYLLFTPESADDSARPSSPESPAPDREPQSPAEFAAPGLGADQLPHDSRDSGMDVPDALISTDPSAEPVNQPPVDGNAHLESGAVSDEVFLVDASPPNGSGGLRGVIFKGSDIIDRAFTPDPGILDVLSEAGALSVRAGGVPPDVSAPSADPLSRIAGAASPDRAETSGRVSVGPPDPDGAPDAALPIADQEEDASVSSVSEANDLAGKRALPSERNNRKITGPVHPVGPDYSVVTREYFPGDSKERNTASRRTGGEPVSDVADERTREDGSGSSSEGIVSEAEESVIDDFLPTASRVDHSGDIPADRSASAVSDGDAARSSGGDRAERFADVRTEHSTGPHITGEPATAESGASPGSADNSDISAGEATIHSGGSDAARSSGGDRVERFADAGSENNTDPHRTGDAATGASGTLPGAADDSGVDAESGAQPGDLPGASADPSGLAPGSSGGAGAGGSGGSAAEKHQSSPPRAAARSVEPKTGIPAKISQRTLQTLVRRVSLRRSAPDTILVPQENVVSAAALQREYTLVLWQVLLGMLGVLLCGLLGRFFFRGSYRTILNISLLIMFYWRPAGFIRTLYVNVRDVLLPLFPDTMPMRTSGEVLNVVQERIPAAADALRELNGLFERLRYGPDRSGAGKMQAQRGKVLFKQLRREFAKTAGPVRQRMKTRMAMVW